MLNSSVCSDCYIKCRWKCGMLNWRMHSTWVTQYRFCSLRSLGEKKEIMAYSNLTIENSLGEHYVGDIKIFNNSNKASYFSTVRTDWCFCLFLSKIRWGHSATIYGTCTIYSLIYSDYFKVYIKPNKMLKLRCTMG